MQQFFSYIQNYYRISDEACAALEENFEEIAMAKGEYLLKEGQTCKHLYFIINGAIRGYYPLEGKDVTHWFGFENDFITSFHSFITAQPAVENIQLIEGSILLVLSKEKLTHLLNTFYELEKLLRIIYEKYYIRLENRFINAQFKTATERYEQLLIETPHIIERVPLGYISSYLGITQETLSRIRSRF